MKPTAKRKLIISLIRDDMINTKLVSGLGTLGLNADDYLLHLSETIFKLMGIGDSPVKKPSMSIISIFLRK